MKCPMRNCPAMQRLRKDAATSTDALAVKLARDTASYTRAEDLGPSVFCTIRDCLGLDPKYKPHRNVDAVRLAKLMSQVIKEKLCKRAAGASSTTPRTIARSKRCATSRARTTSADL